ncbi:MAG TPA: alpha/beta hydrolase [Alphaproteobacteria bacterium]|nr:alpha/beta hydrolase [Alphaproteobacteria bacterium]
MAMGRPVTEPRIELSADGGRIVAPDGVSLPLRHWPAEGGAPRAVLLALHGFNDYSKSWEAPAARWAAQGIATYAYDQSGFGATATAGYWPGSDTLVADAKAAIRALRARHPGVPLYVIGESMGGAVVTALMTRPDPPAVDGVILSAPAVWGRAAMNPFYRFTLWLGQHTLPWLRLTGEGLKIMPSDNIEMLRALGRDPLVIKATRIDAIAGLVDLMDEGLSGIDRIPGPALVLYGDQEQVVDPGAVREALSRLRRAGPRQTRLALYPKGYHMLLRDLNGPQVADDVASWVLRRGPLPSGADRRTDSPLLRGIEPPAPAPLGETLGDDPPVPVPVPPAAGKP